MPRTRANGIEIVYDTFGDGSQSALLLIMGLGGQMIYWDEDLCSSLAATGHFVIRFDNRDVGLSTHFTDVEVPSGAQAKAARRGEKTIPYTLGDMADDAFGLLDALGIDAAHLFGTSMGGMIAQNMVIRRPSRVLSLVSMSSSTGNPGLSFPDARRDGFTFEPEPLEREANVEYTVQGLRALSGKGFPFDEAGVRVLVARAYDRAFYPEGRWRQLAAVIAAPSRKAALAAVKTPTLVIHGDDDVLVPLAHGRDTAASIAGSEFLVVPGMGHDLPRPVWPLIVEAVGRHMVKAEAIRAGITK
jgi:pimeloyl-ACP methyl ester carboxylesterase